MGKYGVTARLVWDGGKDLFLPEEMGTPRADQLQGTIGEKLSEASGRICFDQETEVLTKEGWVKVRDLEKGVEVATYNISSDRMEFQYPTDYIRKTYIGKMYRAVSRSFSVFVTPDHDLFIQKNKKGAFRFQKASDCFGQYAVMKNCAFYDADVVSPVEMVGHRYFQKNPISKTSPLITRTVPSILVDVHQMEDWAKTLGFYISEGTLNFQPGTGPSVVIYQQLQNAGPILEAARGCGLSPKIAYVDKRNGVAFIRIGGSTLARYFSRLGMKSREKRLPDYAFEWPAKLRETLLDALMFGDGTIGPSGTRIYNTNSKGLADDVQRLIVSLGRPCTINYSKCETGLMYRVRETLNKTFSINKFSQQDQWVDYSGDVFCVSVPNRALFVRRDGKIVIAGNCYDSCGTGRSSKDFHPHILGVGHFSVYEHHPLTILWDPTDSDVSEEQFLRACINRPGLWVEPDGYRFRITFNARVVLEWGRWNSYWGMSEHTAFVGELLRYHAERQWPQITPCPAHWDSQLLAQVQGQTELVEPYHDEEKWISMYMSGSRGFSHEQVRHGDRSAISQRSTRFVDESESPWIEHPLEQEYAFQTGDERLKLMGESVVLGARTYYRAAVRTLEAWLTGKGADKLTARKQARGAARGKLGNALETQMIFSASVGQWHRMIRMRCHPAADAEIRAVYVQVLEDILKKSRYAEDFKCWKPVPSSDGMGHCAVEEL